MSVNFKDLTGQRFGKLVVLERAENNKHNESMWVCQCDCGTIKTVSGNNLSCGRTKTCGCGKLGYGDLTGRKYSRLTVLRKVGYGNGGSKWECQCDCGAKVIVSSSCLVRGHNKSCGCLLHRKPYNYLGRDQYPRIYIIWKSMRQRCFSKTCAAYKYYGGKGVTICDEWMDYENFLDWTLKNGYSDTKTIDRIDSDGNYCPENCRWATALVQSNNRSFNKRITYNGETHTVSEWARIMNMNYGTFNSRIKRGWDLERVFNQPLKGGNHDSPEQSL